MRLTADGAAFDNELSRVDREATELVPAIQTVLTTLKLRNERIRRKTFREVCRCPRVGSPVQDWRDTLERANGDDLLYASENAHLQTVLVRHRLRAEQDARALTLVPHRTVCTCTIYLTARRVGYAAFLQVGAMGLGGIGPGVQRCVWRA